LKERYNGNNNGRVGLSVRDLADALLSSKDTASRALKGLQAKGFITVMKRSAFSVKNRTSTEYGLTEYACDITGNLATKEFMKWRPEKNQQSDQKDAQSDRKDSVPAKMLDNATHSPPGRTVKPRSCNSQFDRKDTYRSTTRGNAA
jgi:DNA-binding MarR family transcriptional regulator